MLDYAADEFERDPAVEKPTAAISLACSAARDAPRAGRRLPGQIQELASLDLREGCGCPDWPMKRAALASSAFEDQVNPHSQARICRCADVR